jgi:hypothetical protein
MNPEVIACNLRIRVNVVLLYREPDTHAEFLADMYQQV